MARIRTIKPDFFFDEKISELDHKARLAFIGLWCYSDKEGKMEDSYKVLKAKIFPYENVDFDKILNSLFEYEMIVRYEIEGKKFLKINNFTKHQRPHHTEKDSDIPEPDASLTVKPTLEDGEEKEGRERKGKEEEGKGECDRITVDEIVQGWNKVCGSKGFSKVERLSPDRRSKINSRLKIHKDVEFWQKVFNNITRTPFLMGKNDRKWKVTFDWLFSNDENSIKIYEGNYEQER